MSTVMRIDDILRDKGPKTVLHLADIIQDEMKDRDWTLDDLVMNMGPHFSEADWGICKLSWEMFFAVRTPDILLGDDMAEQLAAAFDLSKEFFLNLHEQWRQSTRATEVEE